MSPEDFARFLEKLSPDAGEAGSIYTSLHSRLVGFFRMKGIADPATAADTALDRVAAKILAGAPVPEVGRYCMGFARNIEKERRRLEHRDSKAFEQFLERLADSSDEEVERISRVLKPCFDRLAEKDRSLLIAYCQDIRGRARAEYRRRLAEQLNLTTQALRMHVTRLRGVLAECVRSHGEGGGV